MGSFVLPCSSIGSPIDLQLSRVFDLTTTMRTTNENRNQKQNVPFRLNEAIIVSRPLKLRETR